MPNNKSIRDYISEAAARLSKVRKPKLETPKKPSSAAMRKPSRRPSGRGQ